MSGNRTIRNLDEFVKQKLRPSAATNQTSIEAEAREILRMTLKGEIEPQPAIPEESRDRLQGMRGRWKGKGTTDELIELTRGEE